MSDKTEFKGVFIGAGWNKLSEKGTKFISAQGGNRNLQLYAVNSETGEQFEVKNFSIFKNNRENKTEKSPDYYMVYFPDGSK
ncbi:MAG: hypothetical protein RIR48_2889 [Bacteroidota bacterium]|jgi:uncharacterized protein (DUF736 family)